MHQTHRRHFSFNPDEQQPASQLAVGNLASYFCNEVLSEDQNANNVEIVTVTTSEAHRIEQQNQEKERRLEQERSDEEEVQPTLKVHESVRFFEKGQLARGRNESFGDFVNGGSIDDASSGDAHLMNNLSKVFDYEDRRR